MNYKASCHCGNVAFAVQAEIDALIECNCSICSRKGSLLFFVPRANVAFSTPESAMSTYTFNTHRIRHNFCSTCGCAPVGFGTDAKGHEMAAVNARCLEDVDLSAFTINAYDGRSA
jgi:hypothetical protein